MTTTLESTRLKIDMFVKPTDCTRYLNRRSYHSGHTFRGIPFSQFRRAAVICTDMSDRSAGILRMEEKFVSSGYKREDLVAARDKALSLDRSALLNRTKVRDDSSQDVMTCIIYQDPAFRKDLNLFFKENDLELKQLLGDDVKIVISERRHPNTSSLLFQKAGFSENAIPMRKNQKCGSSRCATKKQ